MVRVAMLVLTAEVLLAAGTLPLKLLRDLPLPGRTTRFDYVSFDAASGQLFIAHLGDSAVLAFNTRTQRLEGVIRGVSRVHGVLAVPSVGLVFASATGRNQVFAIATGSLRIRARAPAGVYPDGMAYDPARRRLFISDEAGRTDTVLAVASSGPARLHRVATIALGGEAGNTQFDPGTGLMYVDVQTENRLKAISPATDAIVASYPLPGCQHDHGLYIDGHARLAFIACDGNARLLTFDLESRRVLAMDSVGRGPDVLAFDAGLGRLYVAAESGVVAVFQLRHRRLRKLGQAFLAYEAHSLAVDSRHRVYFPLQDAGGHPALRVMAPTP